MSCGEPSQHPELFEDNRAPFGPHNPAKNNVDIMHLAIWLVQNAQNKDQFEKAVIKMHAISRRLTPDEKDQSFINAGAWDYFLNNLQVRDHVEKMRVHKKILDLLIQIIDDKEEKNG